MLSIAYIQGMKLSHVLVGFTIAKMSLTSLGYDECSYKEKLRVSVGPGMYMLGTRPNTPILITPFRSEILVLQGRLESRTPVGILRRRRAYCRTPVEILGRFLRSDSSGRRQR